MTIFQAVPHVPSVCPVSQGDAHPFDSSVLLPGAAEMLQEHPWVRCIQHKEMSPPSAAQTPQTPETEVQNAAESSSAHCDNNCALWDMGTIAIVTNPRSLCH